MLAGGGMKLLLWAMVGGALGSGGRHLLNIGVGRWVTSGFPWSTVIANVTGCFLMGALIEMLALKLQGSIELRTFLATGVLGGYTTFSAFSMDFAHLVQRQDQMGAALYLAGSVGLAILAFYAGLSLARWLLT